MKQWCLPKQVFHFLKKDLTNMISLSKYLFICITTCYLSTYPRLSFNCFIEGSPSKSVLIALNFYIISLKVMLARALPSKLNSLLRTRLTFCRRRLLPPSARLIGRGGKLTTLFTAGWSLGSLPRYKSKSWSRKSYTRFLKIYML